ncbi:MAG: hypothetical protein RI894_1335 [Bacteroidota bacterium]
MAIYSINDLEQLSGIKAHTLRIWEQRYGVIQPKRTPTNIRYYTDIELRKLLNISILNKNGFKISLIAKMSDVNISTEIEQLSKQQNDQETRIDTLAIAMVEMDEIKFEQIVAGSIERVGFEQTMTDIIFPFLEKISLLYFTGSVKPAQEHFITMLIRQKIITEINQIPLINAINAPKFLIFMPEGEKQELSLLYLHYLLKTKGLYVINIGQGITVTDVQVPYDLHEPAYLYTMFTEPHKLPVQQRVETLANTFPKATILLSGYQLLAKPIANPPKNVRILRNLAETTAFLEKI